MLHRTIRMAICVTMLVVASQLAHRGTVLASEGDCFCDFGYNFGVFFYNDDGTFVTQTNGTTSFGIYSYGAASYCYQDCLSYGQYLGQSLCNAYGPGHKYNMTGAWDYDDPNNYYGGSSYGYYSPDPMYEC
jgi:hypothetical protein